MVENEAMGKKARGSTARYVYKSSHPDGQCGCGPMWSPVWLQWTRNPFIIVCFIWIVAIVIFVNSSYFGATLSTIERRFGLSNSQSAFLANLNDLSKTLVVVFFSFIADRTSRPLWLMFSVLLMALGNIFIALPHFLSNPLDSEALLTGRRSTSNSLTNTSWSVNICTDSGGFQSDSTDSGTCIEDSVGFQGLIWWAIVGQIVHGIGQAAFTPVVIPYLDDLAGKNRRRFVLFYSIYTSVWIGAPALGYFIGSSVLHYYVDFERIPKDEIPKEISQKDPRWIGAWWVGFVATACYLFLVAIPMSLLPRDPSANVCVLHPMPPRGNQYGKITDTNNTVEMNELLDGKEQSRKRPKDGFFTILKVFLQVVKRILRRPVLIFFMFFMTLELACIGVFNSFTIKYFQFQFGVSPKRAALLNGAVLLPAAFLGVSVSAFVCHHFKLTLKQCGRYLICNNVITVVLLTSAMFIGCNNPAVAGVNEPYSTMPNGTNTVTCNTDCECDDNIFRPVCGNNGISYLSPCHAGCQTKEGTNSSYTDCACTNPSATEGNVNSSILDSEEFGTAKSGLCEREENCDKKFIYLVLLFGALAFCRFQDNAPINLIALGNSEDEIRTTVYGLSSFVYTIFGFFPTPIYFGAIVNTTCSLWQYACGERAACWLYDIDKLRYAYFGINIGLRLLQIPVCIAIFFTLKESLKPKNGTGDMITKQGEDATEQL